MRERLKFQMTDKIYNVLLLCTGNSARSILGEAQMNTLGAGRFAAFSAGSQPKGDVHPMAIEMLDGFGFPTEGLRSKSWDEVFPGKAITAHWGVEDPAAVEGECQRKAFQDALSYLKRRIDLFLMLPLKSIDELAMRRQLSEIVRDEGASIRAKDTQ